MGAIPRLLVVIPHETWAAGPTRALGKAAANLGEAKWQQIVDRMRVHQRDVLWNATGSRAALNLIREASLLSAARLRRRSKDSSASTGHVGAIEHAWRLSRSALQPD